VLLVAASGVAAVHFAVEHATREEPNYSQIEDGLYLGGYVAEPPPGTQAVLNLCETEDKYRVEVHNWVPIADAEPVPSIEWLREQVAWVDAQRRDGRTVYVHCRNGVSRSGMVVVAYQMTKNGWTRDEAMAFVRTNRPGLRPNPAFMKLLAEWERVVKGQPAAPG
jgi:protein-tyrosine phosphatase